MERRSHVNTILKKYLYCIWKVDTVSWGLDSRNYSLSWLLIAEPVKRMFATAKFPINGGKYNTVINILMQGKNA